MLDYLHDKEMLLVLDNVEQLLPDVGLISEIIKRAPSITILATSRQRLHLYDEWVFDLSGLSYPEENGGSAREYDAVRLFVRAARRVDRSFSPAAAETAVARICQLVAGLPLALEMAAAATRTQSCDQIASAISDNLDALRAGWRDAPDRHKSLRAVFDHSWQLLSAAEQQTLRRLAIFRGPLFPDAVQAVAQASSSRLAVLADKSWLRLALAPAEDGATRMGNGAGRRKDVYDIHPLAHQYLSEKLGQSGAMDSLLARHSDFFTTFLREQEAKLLGMDAPAAVRAIGQRLDDLHAAWTWAAANGRFTAVAACLDALARFYQLRGPFTVGAELLAQAAPHLE